MIRTPKTHNHMWRARKDQRKKKKEACLMFEELAINVPKGKIRRTFNDAISQVQ